MAENVPPPMRAYINVPFWEEGLRTFLSGALARPVNVTAEVLPHFFLLKIIVPYAGKAFTLDHAIDHEVLRRVRLNQQGLLQAEAGMLLSKLKPFFNR